MSYWIMGIGAAAAIAGTVANYQGQEKQARKANRILENSLIASKAETDKSAGELMDVINNYQTDNRQQKQSELQDQAYERIVAPVNESQINRASEQGSTGNVSEDYEKAKSEADAKNLTDLIADARRKAAVVSSQRLRQNEAYKLGDTAAAINQRTLNNNSNLKVANIQAQEVANKKNGLQIGGQIASLLGQAMMMYGAGSALAGGASGAGAAAGSGYGLTMPAASAATGSGMTGTLGMGGTLGSTAGAGTLGSGLGNAGALLGASAGAPAVKGGLMSGLLAVANSKDPFYFSNGPENMKYSKSL